MSSKCYVLASVEGSRKRLELGKQVKNTINFQFIRAGEKAIFFGFPLKRGRHKIISNSPLSVSSL